MTTSHSFEVCRTLPGTSQVFRNGRSFHCDYHHHYYLMMPSWRQQFHQITLTKSEGCVLSNALSEFFAVLSLITLFHGLK